MSTHADEQHTQLPGPLPAQLAYSVEAVHAGTKQVPPTQLSPCSHANPQPPQFAGSDSTSAQPPPKQHTDPSVDAGSQNRWTEPSPHGARSPLHNPCAHV
jgi:hypothetical protein